MREGEGFHPGFTQSIPFLSMKRLESPCALVVGFGEHFPDQGFRVVGFPEIPPYHVVIVSWLLRRGGLARLPLVGIPSVPPQEGCERTGFVREGSKAFWNQCQIGQMGVGLDAVGFRPDVGDCPTLGTGSLAFGAPAAGGFAGTLAAGLWAWAAGMAASVNEASATMDRTRGNIFMGVPGIGD